MPLYGDASGWGVVARLCALTMPPPPERPPSAAEDSPPRSPRSPSPAEPLLAPEIEAERQRVLALELDDIPREQVSDYDAYSRLNILQSYAADPLAFDEYYRMVAERIGDERGLGVVARLLAQVAPSAADAPVLAPELEAERLSVLALDIDNTSPLLIRYLHSGSVDWL